MSKIDILFDSVMHDVMNVPHSDKFVVTDHHDQPRETGTLSHNQPHN